MLTCIHFLDIVDTNPLLDLQNISKFVLPFQRLPFSFDGFLPCAKASYVDIVPKLYSCFISLGSRDITSKMWLQPKSEK